MNDDTEPTSLEIELTVPTPIAYSTMRLRTGATRKPGETMIELGDRLTDVLMAIARAEVRRVEEGMRDAVTRR